MCVVSCLRLGALVKLANSEDFAGQPAVTYWSAIELNIGIVCACLLTLKPLMSRFTSFVASSGSRGNSRLEHLRVEYYFPKNSGGQQANVNGARVSQTVDDDNADNQPLAAVESIKTTTQSVNNSICWHEYNFGVSRVLSHIFKEARIYLLPVYKSLISFWIRWVWPLIHKAKCWIQYITNTCLNSPSHF